ncbi:hypothetical protein [Saccharothrix sp. HUAS TT1]|uniref:hypothetical protein n=1 Tax=unclassified Saccharothrix TaxID=2593673 RepID=UPI00345BBCDB
MLFAGTTSAPAEFLRGSAVRGSGESSDVVRVADLKRIGRKLLEAHGEWGTKRFATD